MCLNSVCSYVPGEDDEDKGMEMENDFEGEMFDVPKGDDKDQDDKVCGVCRYRLHQCRWPWQWQRVFYSKNTLHVCRETRLYVLMILLQTPCTGRCAKRLKPAELNTTQCLRPLLCRISRSKSLMFEISSLC